MGKSFPFSSVPAQRCACPRQPFAPSDSLGGGYARPSCVLPWHSTCSLATSQATWLGASLPTEPLTSSRDLQTPSPGSPRHFSTPPGTCPKPALCCEPSAFSPVAQAFLPVRLSTPALALTISDWDRHSPEWGFSSSLFDPPTAVATRILSLEWRCRLCTALQGVGASAPT